MEKIVRVLNLLLVSTIVASHTIFESINRLTRGYVNSRFIIIILRAGDQKEFWKEFYDRENKVSSSSSLFKL